MLKAACVVFAASLTLLVGLGGNGVAREVAATRAVKRLVKQGDTVEIGDFRGVVVALHPTAVELSDGDGGAVLIPSSRLVRETVSIERATEEATSETG